MKNNTKLLIDPFLPHFPFLANNVLFAVRIAANEAQKINEAVKKFGMAKPEWARNALIQAAES